MGCCQYKTVSGKIEGAEGVLVTLAGGGVATNTLADGSYYFAGLEKGAYTIKPEKEGADFKPSQTNVVLNDTNVSNVDFRRIRKDKYLYWVDRGGLSPGIGSIWRLKVPRDDGDNGEEIASGLKELLGIAVHGKYIYWVDREKGGRIVEAKTDGSDPKDLFINLGNLRDVAIRPNVRPKEVYWIKSAGNNKSEICKALIDSDDKEDIKCIATELWAPDSLEIDLSNKRLYWTDGQDGIFWVSLDGAFSGKVTRCQPLFTTLDTENRRFYYTTGRANPTIEKVNTDGTQTKSLINGPLDGVRGIVIDTDEGRLYFTRYQSIVNNDGTVKNVGTVNSVDLKGENMAVEATTPGIPYDIDISEH